MSLQVPRAENRRPPRALHSVAAARLPALDLVLRQANPPL